MAHRSDLVNRIHYVGLRVFSMLVHWWPVETNLRTARFFGSALFSLDKRHRDRAMANLRRCFPNLTERQRRHIARRSMQHFMMIAVDVMYTPRLVRIDTMARYIRLHNFRDVVDLLLRKNQSVILISGHYGNWEILNYMLGSLGFSTTGVARPLDNPYINRWLWGVRERQGQKFVAQKGAMGEVIDSLARGRPVGFVADQNAGSKGIFVPFFSRLASTYKSIGLLAMEYDAPIVVAYARRVNNHFLFDVGVQDIIYPKDWQDQADPLLYITTRFTKGIEDIVRADPEQYLWAHRRWKTRPKGEKAEVFD